MERSSVVTSIPDRKCAHGESMPRQCETIHDADQTTSILS